MSSVFERVSAILSGPAARKASPGLTVAVIGGLAAVATATMAVSHPREARETHLGKAVGEAAYQFGFALRVARILHVETRERVEAKRGDLSKLDGEVEVLRATLPSLGGEAAHAQPGPR